MTATTPARPATTSQAAPVTQAAVVPQVATAPEIAAAPQVVAVPDAAAVPRMAAVPHVVAAPVADAASHNAVAPNSVTAVRTVAAPQAVAAPQGSAAPLGVAAVGEVAIGAPAVVFGTSDVRVPLRPVVLPVDAAAAAELLAEEIRRALEGGEAIAPVTDPAAVQGIPAAVPANVAVVLSTSGSSGVPKRTMLSGAALRASCAATARRLDGDGDWLLCLPAGFVAGFQVIARAALGGTEVFTLDGGTFDPGGFAAAVERMGSGRRYTSLVPTQVKRLLEDPDGRKALARMDRVLVGGAALDRVVADRLRELTTVVTTYGMTETCGGCVYDGVPLDGVEVRIVDGLIHLGGPTIADGYLGAAPEEAARFYAAEGRRWYATADRGHYTDGLLTSTGRVDDLINTGGVKVSALAVEAVLAELDWIDTAVVLGLPDPAWGELVSACVVPRAGGATGDPEPMRELVRARLGRAAVPKRVVVLDELPLLPNSKIDRLAIRELLLSGAGKD